MKKQYSLSVFLILFFLGLSNSSFADNHLECSNPEKQLELKSWSYLRGANPGRGIVLGASTWTYRGKVIGFSKRISRMPGIISELKVDWNEDSLKILEETDLGPKARRVYLQEVTLSRFDGEALDAEENIFHLTTQVRCTYVYHTTMPR